MSITSERTALPVPSVLAASVAPGWRDITVGGHASVSVDIGVGDTLGPARMLRVFDGLRRELSRHLVGSPGVFIGYDSLRLPRRAVLGPARVIVEARLLGWTERLHDVEYVAMSVADGTEPLAESEPVLARGRGRTLHVQC